MDEHKHLCVDCGKEQPCDRQDCDLPYECRCGSCIMAATAVNNRAVA